MDEVIPRTANMGNNSVSVNIHNAAADDLASSSSATIQPTSLSVAPYSKKLGHRRVRTDGEVTYKKFETTHLMGSIQLGLRQAIRQRREETEEEHRDLLMQDFYAINSVSFNRDGSGQEKTPAHNYSDFRFLTYAPFAFATFRKLFEIKPDLYLASLCSQPMIELSNPGATGSIFYLTRDDNFICKTMQHKETEFLQKLLPGYYLNLQQNPRSLLPKFFGLYVYACNAKHVRIVVMNNLIPSSLKIQHRFDLKGSTYKRRASKKERAKTSATYKDLDFLEMYKGGISLQADIYTSLMNAIERDCRVLESFKIMDYSLLIGIHNVDLSQAVDMNNLVINNDRMIAHSTALESITSLSAEEECVDGDDGSSSNSGEQCGAAINNVWGGIPARNNLGENLLLFIGIIDILQEYGVAKKVEHAWKSLMHDGDSISVHRPAFYARRFQQFMTDKVFKKLPQPVKGSSSFRRNQLRRTISKDPTSNSVVLDGEGENISGSTVIPNNKNSKSFLSVPFRGESTGVTVITIGGNNENLTFSDQSGASSNQQYIKAGELNSDLQTAPCETPQKNRMGLSSDEYIQIYVPSKSN